MAGGRELKGRIRAGDIFQAVLSDGFETKTKASAGTGMLYYSLEVIQLVRNPHAFPGDPMVLQYMRNSFPAFASVYFSSDFVKCYLFVGRQGH